MQDAFSSKSAVTATNTLPILSWSLSLGLTQTMTRASWSQESSTAQARTLTSLAVHLPSSLVALEAMETRVIRATSPRLLPLALPPTLNRQEL